MTATPVTARSPLAAEVPVDLGSDVLFIPRADLNAGLTLFAEHIVDGIASPTPRPASVFAVSAPWGSGKSSAMHVLMELVYAEVEARLPGKVFHRDPRGIWPEFDGPPAPDREPPYLVTTSTLRANLYTRAPMPARLLLAYDILHGLPRSFMDTVLHHVGFEIEATKAGEKIRGDQWLRGLLLENQAAGPMLEQWIHRLYADYVRGVSARQALPGASFAHIHLVDDLDRCSDEFTAELLAALNHWTSLPNVFFVVASDGGHLERAATVTAGTGDATPAEALEKFVHFRLEIPRLVDGHEAAARFAARLVPRTDDVSPGIRRLASLLDSVADDGPLGQLAPALQARTPRKAKRAYNELAQAFQTLQATSGDAVKRIVARIVWPEPYARHIAPVLEAPLSTEEDVLREGQREWLESLLSTGRRVVDRHRRSRASMSVEECRLDLQRWLASRHLDLADLPPDMVLYLAAEPALELPVSTRYAGSPTSAGGGGVGKRPDSPEPGAPAAGLFTGADDAYARAADERRLHHQDLLSQLQIAATARDVDAARALVDEVRASRDEFLDEGLAPTVGNAAVRLESLDPVLAGFLHELAHEADPDHLNIRLNLADFLLDLADPRHLDAVDSHLSWVAERDPAFRPTRQLLLRLRACLVGERDPAAGELERLAAEAPDAQFSTAERARTLEVLVGLGPLDAADGLARQWFEASVTAGERDGAVGWLALYADQLLGRGPTADGRGGDIHRWLLSRGWHRAPEGYLASLHNLAVFLYAPGRDYDDAAGVLWQAAYDLSPQDPNVRTSYTRYLLAHRSDVTNAQAVQQGQSVTLPTISPAERARVFADVPDHFDGSPPPWWWETVDLDPSEYVLPELQPGGEQGR